MAVTPTRTAATGPRSLPDWTSAVLSWPASWGAAIKNWLTPLAVVRLFQADGGESSWLARDPPVPCAANTMAQFSAIEIPEEMFLSRRLTLPAISDANLRDALQLEVRSNSPFEINDVVWGFAVRGSRTGPQQRHVDLVLASRSQVQQALIAGASASPQEQMPEVWAMAGMPAPVVIGGFGEARRLEQMTAGRKLNSALLGLAVFLLSLVLITPTAQLRARALEAVKAHGEVMAKAAPLVRKRDELAMLNERLKSLDVVSADRVDPATVLEHLTRILPDDTHLYSLDVQHSKITASGHTVDASALLQRLSADPRLRGVRSPTAVTRLPGATKEAFTVEFTMQAAGAATASISRPPPAALAPPGSPFSIGGSQ